MKVGGQILWNALPICETSQIYCLVECRDGLARITSKELAITHVVKNGTLQNACSTRPRVVVGLGKSAHTHIVRLTHSRQKGPNRIMTKVMWLC